MPSEFQSTFHCPSAAKLALKLFLEHWEYHHFYLANLCVIPFGKMFVT